jgi:hypothetical protein
LPGTGETHSPQLRARRTGCRRSRTASSLPPPYRLEFQRRSEPEYGGILERSSPKGPRRTCRAAAGMNDVLEVRLSLRANGSRECAPDDRLREAIQEPKKKDWIASSFALRASADAVVARTPRNDGISDPSIGRAHNHDARDRAPRPVAKSHPGAFRRSRIRRHGA